MIHRPGFFLDQHLKYTLILILWLISGAIVDSMALQLYQPVKVQKIDSSGVLICKGLVMDAESGLRLALASISVEGTKMATVTNSEGEFLLKIPETYRTARLLVSFLGYQKTYFPVSVFLDGISRLELKVMPVPLPEVNVVFKDAESLMKTVLEKRGDNYVNTPTLMTAFYRETIRKRKTYVVLLESVVDVLKMPYTSVRRDVASLYKVRKNTDYAKLDTVVFKLMGGPYNTLFSDLMKTPEDMFTEKIFENYTFSFDRSTRIDDRLVYVLNFKQRSSVPDPLYYGKLYIDSETLALVSAVYDINLADPEKVSGLFIRKKPLNAKVTVTKARYQVNYLVRDNQWYLGYSRAELGVEINWKRRLFHTNYESVMEMAVTDWTSDVPENWNRSGSRLRTNVVVSDAVTGFLDPDFWGLSNVIEPDKSIESAIRKITRKLEQHK